MFSPKLYIHRKIFVPIVDTIQNLDWNEVQSRPRTKGLVWAGSRGVYPLRNRTELDLTIDHFVLPKLGIGSDQCDGSELKARLNVNRVSFIKLFGLDGLKAGQIP